MSLLYIMHIWYRADVLHEIPGESRLFIILTVAMRNHDVVCCSQYQISHMLNMLKFHVITQ